MENKFCFLKGLVECESGRIQDCNMKRLNKCPLEEKKEEPNKKKDRVLVVIIIVLAAALAVIKIVEFIADGEFQQTDATNENVIIQ